MRRDLLLSISLSALFLAGCPSKPKNGECKTSDDCKDQQGFGQICVQGRCQECGADTDCKAGFVCRDNKCAPRPECESDAQCSGGGKCQDGKCVAAAKPGCSSDADCGAGMACKNGSCVTSTDTAAASAEAVRRCVSGASGDNGVHFAFDKADLDAQARGTLDKMAQCLKGVSGAKLLVEGHCDERGTAEYNVQLGERRAEAVKKYLANLGIEGGSIRTTSYGKEKPVCTEHEESCWAKNRRGVVAPDTGAGPTSSTDSLERQAAR